MSVGKFRPDPWLATYATSTDKSDPNARCNEKFHCRILGTGVWYWMYPDSLTVVGRRRVRGRVSRAAQLAVPKTVPAPPSWVIGVMPLVWSAITARRTNGSAHSIGRIVSPVGIEAPGVGVESKPATMSYWDAAARRSRHAVEKCCRYRPCNAVRPLACVVPNQ